MRGFLTMNVLVELQCSFLKTYCPAIFNDRELVTKSDKEYFVFKNNEFLSPVFATELGAILIQQITIQIQITMKQIQHQMKMKQMMDHN